ncbi:sensor histidine kinase [Streptomyces nodosus]|nr:histidine kinase [Streptomyces nodosus]MBB4792586.1 signal transduction histidine kinase [Streptomyces nodosus]
MSRYEGGLDPWSRALGWWGDKGASARVELYTRWTFHCVALIQLLAVAGPVALSDGPGAPRAVLATLLALHSGLTALACSRALGSLLDHREPPMRLVAAHMALSGLVVVVAVTLARAGTDPAQRSMAVAVALGPVIFGPMAPALVARPGRVAQLVLSFSVALVLLMSVLSLPWQQTVVLGMASLGGGLLMAFSSRFSVWLLAVVLELESARVTQARLAVAEERLRIGRDLHDVMGRNLTVIALKGELAVQLARRGSPAAVAQMVEVQRIARDSHREIREVVRGYRVADLHAELIGAGEVLRAAGIDCGIKDGCVDVLPEATAAQLGWVIREGTTNVLRHADADRCTIRLRQVAAAGGRVWELVMENNGARPGQGAGQDGSGPAGSAVREGSGLAGLRERLAGQGGVLRAERQPRGVFRLTVRIPVTPTETAGASAAPATPVEASVTPVASPPAPVEAPATSPAVEARPAPVAAARATVTEGTTGTTGSGASSRPSGAGLLRVLGGSLASWVARRPLREAGNGKHLLAHSSDTRQMITVLAVLEIVAAFLVSLMIPPVLRPYHAVFEVLLVLTALGAVAATARHPHLVSDAQVVLRTGLLGELVLPRGAVRSASRVLRTVPGRGLRPVAGDARAVACSVGGTVDVCLRLDPPVAVDLGESGVVAAGTVYTSVDSPEAFLRALRMSDVPRPAPHAVDERP